MYSLTHNTVVSVHSGVKISVKLYYFNNTNISLMLMLYNTRVGLHYTLACVHNILHYFLLIIHSDVIITYRLLFTNTLCPTRYVLILTAAISGSTVGYLYDDDDDI